MTENQYDKVTEFKGDFEAMTDDKLREFYIEFTGQAYWEEDEDGTSHPDDPVQSRSLYLGEWELDGLTIDGIAQLPGEWEAVLASLHVAPATIETMRERIDKLAQESCCD